MLSNCEYLQQNLVVLSSKHVLHVYGWCVDHMCRDLFEAEQNLRSPTIYDGKAYRLMFKMGLRQMNKVRRSSSQD